MQLRGDVLVLHGDSDEILPPALAKRWEATLAARGQGSVELVMCPRAGHSPHLECAGFVADQIVRFVAPSGRDRGERARM